MKGLRTKAFGIFVLWAASVRRRGVELSAQAGTFSQAAYFVHDYLS